jgi:hypothetical protein
MRQIDLVNGRAVAPKFSRNGARIAAYGLSNFAQRTASGTKNRNLIALLAGELFVVCYHNT